MALLLVVLFSYLWMGMSCFWGVGLGICAEVFDSMEDLISISLGFPVMTER